MIVGTGVGLGYIIIQSRWSLDYTSAFVAIIIIVAIGLTTE
jgi:ABC-type nitrate/sulfonate/bicarbonate transport system permease component